jgi:hypothetical protein
MFNPQLVNARLHSSFGLLKVPPAQADISLALMKANQSEPTQCTAVDMHKEISSNCRPTPHNEGQTLHWGLKAGSATRRKAKINSCRPIPSLSSSEGALPPPVPA